MFDFRLTSPTPVLLAQEKQRGLHWTLEVLVFLIVFIVSYMGQFLFMLPAHLICMLSSTEYQEVLALNGEAQAMEYLIASDGYTALTLLSEIMMIAIALLFCKLLQKRDPGSLGLIRRGMIREYIVGAMAGALAFSIAVLLCVITGSLHLEGISSAFQPGIFVLLLAGFLVQGMAEEVLCRGYLMVSLARRYPLWVAVLTNSVLFAALHLFNSGMTFLAFINLALFGVFASLYFIQNGNIWGIGAFHALWNFVQGNVYGILVSGGGSNCTLLDSVTISGRELMHGGAFGLEGGLAVTIVLALGSLFMLHQNEKKHIKSINDNQ